MMYARILTTTIMALALTGGVANAQSPTLLNQFKDWAAYAHSGKNGKFCYALSKPTDMSPADRNHGDVFFFVSTRPKEGVSNEPSLLVGYPFKENSSVTIDVDGKKFEMFTKGDGAWVKNAADENRLVTAMRAGRSMKVSGRSSRGTGTNYTYSLSGITAAVKAAADACK